MKLVRGLIAGAGICALAFGGAAFSQSTVNVGSDNGPVGGSAIVPVDIVADPALGAFNFSMDYDVNVCSSVTYTAPGAGAVTNCGAFSCSNPVAGVIACICPGSGSAVTSGSFGTLTCDNIIAPPPPNDTWIERAGTAFFDTVGGGAAGAVVIASPTVIVDAPDIAATVNPVDFGSPVVMPPGPAIGTIGTMISNSGQAGTTLTGTCNLNPILGTGLSADQDPLVLSLAAGASTTVNFTCDNSIIQTNTATYDCTGLNASSGPTFAIPVSCDVVAPGPAIYGDDTVGGPGGTFDIVAPPGALPNSGTFTNTVNIRNDALAGNGDMTLLACVAGAGDANITIQTPPAATISAQGTSGMVLACDTTGAAVGTLTRDIDCNYELDTPANGLDGPTTITANCPIRAPTSVMTPALADMSTITINVLGPGGQGSSNFSFTNTGDPGTTATLQSCVPMGTDALAFTVSNDNAALMSGQTQVVTVDGQDPNPFTDATLLCTFDDDAGGAGQTVTYILGFNIRPLIVPTIGQMGLILMALMLAGFGVYTVREREQN